MPVETYYDLVRRLERDPPMFEKVEIETNIGCNRECRICFLATRKREHVVSASSRIMDRELYRLLLKQLSTLNFSGELNFHFYAEPLLNKRLAWFSVEAKQHLPSSKIVLYTNGDFLTVARHQELREAGIDVFFVTRHDDDVPDWLAPVLSEPNVFLDYGSTIRLNNRGGYLGPPVNPRVHSFPCVYPSLAVIVTIDGNVLPCSCDFDEKMSFGNIKESSLFDIWNSAPAKSFRSAVLAGRRADYALCRDCDYYSSEVELYDHQSRT